MVAGLGENSRKVEKIALGTAWGLRRWCSSYFYAFLLKENGCLYNRICMDMKKK